MELLPKAESTLGFSLTDLAGANLAIGLGIKFPDTLYETSGSLTVSLHICFANIFR